LMFFPLYTVSITPFWRSRFRCRVRFLGAMLIFLAISLMEATSFLARNFRVLNLSSSPESSESTV